MDEDVTNLLQQWGLAEYIPIFKENRVTINNFGLLNYNMVTELIKPAGDRAHFLKNFEDWKILINESSLPSCDEINITYVDMLNSSHKEINMKDLFVENNNKEYVKNSQNQQSSLETKPLKELLIQSNEGRALLNLYETEGILSSSGRRKLCNIIIKDLLEKGPECRIDSTTLLHKAQLIKDVFPKENISTYFIPYINNTQLKIKRCAKGKLYDCLQNRRREYREAKVIQRKNSSNPNEPGSSEASSADGEFSDNSVSADDILWLQSACDPWHTVEQKWKSTAKYRLNEIKGGSIDIAEYMNKYPVLKTPTGYQLLVEDFKVLYPGYEEKLFENFALYKKRILELAIKRLINTQDPTIKQIVNQSKELFEGEENSIKQEATSIAAFMLIPLVLGNPLAKNKKSSWRPSKQETRDGFVTHVIRPMDVQDTLNRRKEKYSKLGVTFQPTIVIVGPNYSEIEKYYVVVNNTFYVVKSILQAVDVCFKIYHSLHSKYPVESVSIWSFIQKGLYNIKTPWDKCYTTVSAFITDLGIDDYYYYYYYLWID